MRPPSRMRGIKDLVQDAVEHGSRGVQAVHLGLAGRTFSVLEAIPPLAAPAKVAHAIYDGSTSVVYEAVRLGNRGVGALLDVVITATETEDAAGPPPDAAAPPPNAPERRTP